MNIIQPSTNTPRQPQGDSSGPEQGLQKPNSLLNAQSEPKLVLPGSSDTKSIPQNTKNVPTPNTIENKQIDVDEVRNSLKNILGNLILDYANEHFTDGERGVIFEALADNKPLPTTAKKLLSSAKKAKADQLDQIKDPNEKIDALPDDLESNKTSKQQNSNEILGSAPRKSGIIPRKTGTAGATTTSDSGAPDQITLDGEQPPSRTDKDKIEDLCKKIEIDGKYDCNAGDIFPNLLGRFLGLNVTIYKEKVDDPVILKTSEGDETISLLLKSDHYTLVKKADKDSKTEDILDKFNKRDDADDNFIEVKGDGNCLFACFLAYKSSVQKTATAQVETLTLRKQLATDIRKNPDKYSEELKFYTAITA